MTNMLWEGAFADVDPLTLRLIVQLQLEDSAEVAARAKGKQREDTKTDAQIALDAYVEDLKRCDSCLQDRTMAQSIAVAVLQDGDLIVNEYRKEQQFARDRELANRLANGEDIPAYGAGVSQMKHPKKDRKAQEDPWEDQELLEKVAAIYMHPPENEDVPIAVDDYDSEGTVAESSIWAASRKQTSKRPLRACVACGEERDFFEVARVPCNHEYCRPCLESLFTLSMKDGTLFPPRCDGQEIPLESVRLFLPSKVAKEFEAKYDELSTRDRTYCHEPSCNAFVPNALHVNGTATCPKCSKTTCAACKGPSHSGDCPNDKALQQLVETANAAQWQRCYQCHRFVELLIGCNHMRCVCLAEFCYVCGARWKTCVCAQWDEGYLLDRATQLVNRNPNRRLFQPVRVAHRQPDGAATGSSSATHSNTATQPASSGSSVLEDPTTVPAAVRNGLVGGRTPEHTARRSLIAQAMEDLRDNHECQHSQWKFVRGRNQCEECQDYLKEYIFECRQCDLRACNRCRRNRL